MWGNLHIVSGNKKLIDHFYITLGIYITLTLHWLHPALRWSQGIADCLFTFVTLQSPLFKPETMPVSTH